MDKKEKAYCKHDLNVLFGNEVQKVEPTQHSKTEVSSMYGMMCDELVFSEETINELVRIKTNYDNEKLNAMLGCKYLFTPTKSELEEYAEDGEWLYLNFEAIKASPPTELDPRKEGEALWPQQQDERLLTTKRNLDPARFEAMYQGHPTSQEGLLYGNNFQTYEQLPRDITLKGNYTDTADMGEDYLASVCYSVDSDGVIYITDVVYTQEPMESSERLVSEMLRRNDTRRSTIESNNGGRGFARAIQRLVPSVRIEWFHQSGNKEARILSNSATALHMIRMPKTWHKLWPEFYSHLTTYRRLFRSNRHDDAADAITGVVEREVGSTTGRWKCAKFI